MATIFTFRAVAKASRATLLISIGIIALALVAALFGVQHYRKLTTTTVAAYFSQALALYPGDTVQIMGIEVGSIDKVEPAGDKMKVTFHYASSYQVPANANASILNPSLVSSRTIQLSPPYTDGPVLADGAVIPLERTRVPAEWDDLRNSLGRLTTGLGPTAAHPAGPFGELIESAANGFAGKAKQLNDTINALSGAASTLSEGRGDFFAAVRSLAVFVDALSKSDRQFQGLNTDLAAITDKFAHTDHELADALHNLQDLVVTTRDFTNKNADVLIHDLNNVSEVTTALLQPEPKDALETILHVAPNAGASALNAFSYVNGGLMQQLAISQFANPLQFICSAIQAGSRLGYQDSAELCAQYLTPVLDAIKFNFPPVGANLFNSAHVLPKQIAYSDPRLQPPSGYKDTTVPGIWARDTFFSRGNREPGWIVAPGMQGVGVQPLTQSMLTAASLAELMGGADVVAPPAPPHVAPLPAPPDSYDESSPLPPPWYPQPGPPPGPEPGVSPGPAVAEPQPSDGNPEGQGRRP
ncbi:virulence factor Mce family protein [Mycobacterium intracellulare]|uniref:virulence factor Mce family protein n=1 Tax=Mycobacterium intracellulare TaxID=1767 RepID=UPI001CDB14E8|nr:virulence factor Mce family protein [Mycobacterium intracellulare]MCA2255989.1 virulence factor Mce family protein [Mycobacterium intracellulare]